MWGKTQQTRFEAMVNPHIGAAYNYARWITRNHQDSEDVVQEACLRAFKFFDRFRGEAVRPWLFAIVRNTAYTWLKKNRSLELPVLIDELPEVSSETSNPESLLMQQVDRDLLKQGIENLPLEYREAIVLRELEGLSYKEIATIANIPVGTVMSRLARARARLQEYLTKPSVEVPFS